MMGDVFGAAGLAIAMAVAGAAAAEPPPSALEDVAAGEPLFAVEPAAVRSLTEDAGFTALERAYQSEIETARAAGAPSPVETIRSLAAIYAAHGLHAEAVAFLADLDPAADADLRLQLGRSLYAMGRYGEALTLLEDMAAGGEASAIVAMAASRQGADARAMEAFAASPAGPWAGAEFFLLQTESAFATDDVDAAEAALSQLLRFSMTPAEDAMRALHAARLLSARGDDAAADKRFREVETRGVEPAAARAELLRLLNVRVSQGGAALDFDRLFLRSDDPRYRRALGFARADAASDDPRRAIAALRDIAEGFPDADDSDKAARRLRRVLPELFDPEVAVPPIDAARFFFENIDYAPPGAEGDRLIREVAERLTALDLGDAASELLEHQVFNRLRGFQRSIIAADLAEIYLIADKPQEALRVIRSTRIAGLAEEANDRRRLLEARALVATGKEEMALILLDGAGSVEGAALKAEILWRAERWGEAGAAYASLASAKDMEDRMAEYFLRAGAAFAMAEDAASLRTLVEAHRGREALKPALTMVEGLDSGAPDAAASARRFLEAYRVLFGEQDVENIGAG